MNIAPMSSFVATSLVSDSKACRKPAIPTGPITLAAAVLFILLSWANQADAQNYLTQVGSPTFTTAQPVELGFINLANGNLHLQVPLASSSQREVQPFVAGLAYDSRIWKVVAGTWQPTNVANSQGGWRLATSADKGSVSYSVSSFLCKDPPNPGFETDYGNFAWTGPDGTLHAFYGISTSKVPTECGGGSSPTGDALADDASGYHMYVTNYYTAVVVAPDGTRVYPTVMDTNGNYFSADANGNVIDTLGRTPITYVPNGTGCTATYCYNILNSQGSTSQIKVTTQTISVSTNFGQSGVTEYSGSITVIQSIQLPDNTTYQFSYDSGTTAGHYGVLTGITLPTGGQVSYGYTIYQDSFGTKNSWVSSRTSGGGTWNYAPLVITTCASGTVGCQQKLTMTKPSGDNTVYTFTLNNGAWKSQVQSYTGAVSATNLVANLTSTWDFSQPCLPSPCTGASRIRVLRTTTTLPTPGGNSVTSKTEMTYADTTTSNLGSIKEWKFYAGTAPTFPTIPDRETDFTYLATSAYTAKNILNRPLTAVVKNSGGTIVAQTVFNYDTGTPTSVSGVTHHDDTNFGTGNTVRGNLTTIQRCIVVSTCSSLLSSTLTYDTTGQVTSVNDPALNTFNLSYADNYFNDDGNTPPATYAPTAPTNAYLTQVTLPGLT